MREFIGDKISIDGRMIKYKLVTGSNYLEAKYEYSDEEVEKFIDENSDLCERLEQIMALKQSCFLLSRTSHSSQVLSDSLHWLKDELILELKNKYDFEFDEQFVEEYGF